MSKTILIGGKYHGQPIGLTRPALPTIVMLDGPKSHEYTLAHFESEKQGDEKPEMRSFYVADNTEPGEARQRALENWKAGAILHK